MYKFNHLSSILLMLVLSACAGAPTQYHAIRPLADVASITNSGERQPVTALRNLTLPSYLEQENIVYLKGNSQVVIADNQRWAEPFVDNLRNVIIKQLQTITDNPRTLAFPLANNIRPERIIDIQISDFAPVSDQHQLTLHSNWQITTPEQHNHNPPGYQFNRQYPLSDDSIEAVMSAYQQAVADLTVAIAKSL